MASRSAFHRGTVVTLLALPVLALGVISLGGGWSLGLSIPETRLVISLAAVPIVVVAAVAAVLCLVHYAETSDQRILLLVWAFAVLATLYLVYAQHVLHSPDVEIIDPIARATFAGLVLAALAAGRRARRGASNRRIVGMAVILSGGAAAIVIGAEAFYGSSMQSPFGGGLGRYLDVWNWGAVSITAVATGVALYATRANPTPLLQALSLGFALLTEAGVLFLLDDPGQATWWLGYGTVAVAAGAMGAGLAIAYSRGDLPYSRIFDIEGRPVADDGAARADVVLVADGSGRVMGVGGNPRAAFKTANVRGRLLQDLPDGEAWLEVLRGGGGQDLTVHVGGGSWHDLRITTAPMPTLGGGAVLIGADVTAEYQARERAERLTADLERSREGLERRAETLEEAYMDVVRGLGAFGSLLAKRDLYDASHNRRLADLAVRVAGHAGMSEGALRHVRDAAILYDIGKICVPERVLTRSGGVSEGEWDQIREVPLAGERVMREFSFLRTAGKIVRHVHERYDGSGYPDGLAGEQIPMGARVVAACAAFLAMTSDRPYRPAMSVESAVHELRSESGRQFCPSAVAALADIVDAQARRDRGAAVAGADPAGTGSEASARGAARGSAGGPG